MATMMGKEWGGMGQNLSALVDRSGLPGISHHRLCGDLRRAGAEYRTESDIIMAIWSCVGYTVLLCFTLFQTGSLAKSVFNAH